MLDGECFVPSNRISAESKDAPSLSPEEVAMPETERIDQRRVIGERVLGLPRDA